MRSATLYLFVMRRTVYVQAGPGTRLLFAMGIILTLFLALEGTARLIEAAFLRDSGTAAVPDNPGWQTSFFQSVFDWHEPDPDLLWRFRPNLQNRLIKTNSRGLIAGEIPYEKPDSTYRIMVVGDSSPVGLGLRDRGETFPEILKRRLTADIRVGHRVEVINASVSGYTSEQVRRFLERDGWDYRPDLLIVYCGNNDASISGAYSDHELLGRAPLRGVRRIVSRLAVYRVLRSVIRGVLPKQSPKADSPEELAVRVAQERFEENVRVIADQSSTIGCRLILIRPPVPMLWPAGLQFRSLRHVTGEDGRLLFPRRLHSLLGRSINYCLSDTLFARLYGHGDEFTRFVYASASQDTLSPEQSLAYWLAQAGESKEPVAANNAGVVLWRIGKHGSADSAFVEAFARYVELHGGSITTPAVSAGGAPFLYNRGINSIDERDYASLTHVDSSASAFRWLDSALQLDFFSLRIKRDYVAALRSVALQRDVVLLDPSELFRTNGGERLFVDHCHPTAEGHRLLADTLRDIVESLPGFPSTSRGH